MIKMMAGAACAVMMLAAGAPAGAQDADGDSYTFQVSNSSSMSIVTFHLASKTDADWSEDLIPNNVLEAGHTYELYFTAAADECEYATAVVMEDGTTHDATVDYCNLTGIDIDDENGITYY